MSTRHGRWRCSSAARCRCEVRDADIPIAPFVMQSEKEEAFIRSRGYTHPLVGVFCVSLHVGVSSVSLRCLSYILITVKPSIRFEYRTVNYTATASRVAASRVWGKATRVARDSRTVQFPLVCLQQYGLREPERQLDHQ